MCKKREDDEEMALPIEKINHKLNDLKKRAEKRRNSPNFRKNLTETQSERYSNEAKDLYESQYRTIK